MKKITAFLLFLVSLTIVASVYIVGNMFFLPVLPIYCIIATVSMCAYIFMLFHHNNEIGLAKMNGKEVPEQLLEKRRKRMKIMLIIFFPFLLVVLIDSIFLILIKDSAIYDFILNLFK